LKLALREHVDQKRVDDCVTLVSPVGDHAEDEEVGAKAHDCDLVAIAGIARVRLVVGTHVAVLAGATWLISFRLDVSRVARLLLALPGLQVVGSATATLCPMEVNSWRRCMHRLH
jgi:hypothetical protein